MHAGDIPYASPPLPKPPTLRQKLEVSLELLYTGGKLKTYVVPSPNTLELLGLGLLGPGAVPRAQRRPVIFDVPVVKGWKVGTKVTYNNAVPNAGKPLLSAPFLGHLPKFAPVQMSSSLASNRPTWCGRDRARTHTLTRTHAHAATQHTPRYSRASCMRWVWRRNAHCASGWLMQEFEIVQKEHAYLAREGDDLIFIAYITVQQASAHAFVCVSDACGCAVPLQAVQAGRTAYGGQRQPPGVPGFRLPKE